MLQKYELEEIQLLAKHNNQHQKELHGQIKEKMKELEELFKQMKKDPLDESTIKVGIPPASKSSVETSNLKPKLNSIEEETLGVNVEIKNAAQKK
jgi:DNA-binding protein H-NS